MEAENKLYADMHGDGQGQPAPDPPKYTPTPQEQGQSQGFPPSTMAASPYYAPPSGAGYGGGYGVTPSQQQQQVTVVAGNQSPVVYVHPDESYIGAMIYSCFVCWCCSPLFGLIGFLLAMVASDKAVTDPQGARSLGRASYIVSSVGIVVSIIVVAIYFGVFHGSVASGISCTYMYEGSCYRHFSSYVTSSECALKGGVYKYYSGCYYN